IGPRAFKVDAGCRAIVLEANGTAYIDLVDSHIAVAIGHRQHSLHLASQAYCFVITADTYWVFQRYVLRHADGAIRANGHSEGSLTIIRATDNTPDHQVVYDIEFDGKASSSGQARVGSIAAHNSQAELRGCAFLILPI